MKPGMLYLSAVIQTLEARHHPHQPAITPLTSLSRRSSPSPSFEAGARVAGGSIYSLKCTGKQTPAEGKCRRYGTRGPLEAAILSVFILSLSHSLRACLV